MIIVTKVNKSGKNQTNYLLENRIFNNQKMLKNNNKL